MMFLKGCDDNNILLYIILFFCLCNDGDIFDDLEDYLPLLLILFCFCDDIFDDIEDYLPWLLVLLCCCND